MESHLSERVSVGTGEIIDSDSKPGDNRNQIDIVIYKTDFPRLEFGGGIFGYLAESVVATIEVKSNLTESELSKSIKSAVNVKNLEKHLTRTLSSGYQPPSILSYIIAYDGPKNIKTVHKWIDKTHKKLRIPVTNLSLDTNIRLTEASPSIDGVFILRNGFLYFDNVPFGFVTDDLREKNPSKIWFMSNNPDGNLLLLFLFLTVSISGSAFELLDPVPYLKSFNVGESIFSD